MHPRIHNLTKAHRHIAGQIAKLKGCRVVGIAGGPQKLRFLTEKCKFDDVIDYKSSKSQVELGAKIREACPKGSGSVV